MEHRLNDLRMNFLPGLKVNLKPSDDELQSAFKFGKNFAEKLNEKLNKNNVPTKTIAIKK
jgi:NADH oxidase (H2O-forming)